MKSPKVARALTVSCLFLGFGVALSVFASMYAYLSYHAPLANKHGTQGLNALWLAHSWVGEQHTAQEYEHLASLLRENEITDAFFHVGPLDSDGSIDGERCPFAEELVRNLKLEYPELRVQAWMGQVERSGGGSLDLADEEVRASIVGTASKFLDLGFDGIHYNIEPVFSGDPHFLDLLERTSTLTRDQGKVLSVASDELEPFPGAECLVRLFSSQAGLWNREYYLQVTESADQIAVMMYDSALPTDWLYGTLVEWETKALVELVGDEVTLFVGVPTYQERRWSFHPEAENVESGLRGIQKGLEHLEAGQLGNFGIAIYAEWTTDEDEWAVYREKWLGVR